MDNKSVNFAMRFNNSSDDYARKLRGVATMGLNLKKVLAENKNIAGVAYEVPAYLIITQFRYLVKAPISTILTIYRASEFQGGRIPFPQ